MNRLLSYISCCLLLSSSCFLMSCKEKDDTIDEFPNWAHQNDEYYSIVVAEARDKIASGDASWAVFPSYSKPTTGYDYQYFDYVVAKKLENGSGTVSPIMTDTVLVHYVGRLKESNDKYKTLGMEFDRSFPGGYNAQTDSYDFDPALSTPVKFAVSGLINGFSTALMQMHAGDHWRVYIPYQLGYGTSTSGSIPGGSTLIFDLRLESFWHKK